jgi:zinc protease
MIFKGTKKLSESDINMITHKLSGYTNAFTSYDYTGYLFDFPSQQWEAALGILADCMRNASFKEEHLNSELKAVIQELKMYKDSYVSSVIEDMIGMMFSDHPYHHPIIGYKQDLWSLKRESLVQFYQKHYIPNNATLVIVGDIDSEKTKELAMKEFGHLQPNFSYERESFYHGSDLQSKSVTIYRDVQVPSYILAWEIPGSVNKIDYLVNIILWVLADGKGSRLYKKLVDELELVTDVDVFSYDLFDAGVLFFYFQPSQGVSPDAIIDVLNKEVEDIVANGVSHEELTRAIKQVEIDHLSLFESYSKQAYELGKSYLATGDENYAYTMTSYPKEELAVEIQSFLRNYLRPALMQKGSVMPIFEQDKEHWVLLQELSDKEDERILAGRTRELEVEEGRYVKEIQVMPPKHFAFPQAKTFFLSNGLKLLTHCSSELPKIELLIDLVADHLFDPKGKEGLSSFVAAMLLEGTRNYTAEEFARTAESLGMSIVTAAGQIKVSMLSEDLPKALELLQEMLLHATMHEEAIERVRVRMLASLKEFWDTPKQFATQLLKQEIYQDHPYSKNAMGTEKGVQSITRDDIVAYYRKFMSPQGARMALVGDTTRYDLQKLLSELLALWHGSPIDPLVFPEIQQVSWRDVNYQIMRDQTVLCYGGLSVSRLDSDYDKLALFDQIFTGGVLGSMASRLFDLREQSGLFYTIGGSLLSHVDKDKGLIMVRTIVSNDRRKEAEVAIEQVINTAIDSVTDDEFMEAQQAITNNLVGAFESQISTAATLLALDKFGLPHDYFDSRAVKLAQITKKEMQEVVRNYLRTDRFILVRAGRV